MDANLLTITDGIVQSDVGVCFFDPVEETIKEIGPSSGYVLGAEPYVATVHKLLFVTSNSNISQAKIKLRPSPEVEALYDIKILTGASNPPIERFDDIRSFNDIEIVAPIQPHSLIPFFVYVKAKSEIRKMISLPIEVSYEF